MWSPLPQKQETQPLIVNRDLPHYYSPSSSSSSSWPPATSPPPSYISTPPTSPRSRIGPPSPTTHRPRISSPLRQAFSNSSTPSPPRTSTPFPRSSSRYPSYSTSPWSLSYSPPSLKSTSRKGSEFPASHEIIDGGVVPISEHQQPREVRVQNWRRNLEVRGLRRNFLSNMFASLMSLAPSGTATAGSRRGTKAPRRLGGALEIIVHWTLFLVICLVFYTLIAMLWALVFQYAADPAYFIPFPRNFLETFWISFPILSGLFVPLEFRNDPGEDPGKSSWLQTLANLEAFHAEILKAIITGLIFARFSRPGRRVSFSNVGVLQVFPTLVPRPVLHPHEFSEEDEEAEVEADEEAEDGEEEEEKLEGKRIRGGRRRRSQKKTPKNIRGVLKMRIANETAARINGAKMKASLVLNTKTPAISPFCAYYKGAHRPITVSIEKSSIPLKLKRTSLMSLEHTWTVEHWIDEDSPLYRMKDVEKELKERDAEISCLFSAHDADYGESLYIHEVFLFGENVVMNHEFVDVFYFLPSGKLCFDLNRLHLTEAVDLNEERVGERTPNSILQSFTVQ